MGAIIVELQKDALDRNVRASDLLRKALVVARKLHIEDFETWINRELNGYKDKDDIPDYRIFSGQVQYRNPYHGWCPVVMPDRETAQLLSRRACADPIATSEALIRDRAGKSMLTMPLPDDIAAMIMKYTTGLVPTLVVDYSAVAGLVDVVRSIVLKWALKLEEDGILGEELTFTEKEKARAAGVAYTVNNFYGPVSQSQIQSGTGHVAEMSSPELDLVKVGEFVNALTEASGKLGLADDERARLQAEIQTVKAQLDSPKPKDLIIREGLSSLRRILEGASGGVAAQLLVNLGRHFF